MSEIYRYKLENDYTEVPNDLAQDAVQKGGHLSGNAFMILVNIMSYPLSWKIYKTELHNRYEKLKRTAVDSAWKELVENGYVLQFRYRNGKKYDYIYAMRMKPFSDREKENIEKELKQKHANLECWFSTVQNEQSKMSSPKSTANKETDIKNTDNKNTFKETDQKDQDQETGSKGNGQTVQFPNINFDQLEIDTAMEVYKELGFRKYQLPLPLINALREEIKKTYRFRTDWDLKTLEEFYLKNAFMIDNDIQEGEYLAITEYEFTSTVMSLYRNGDPIKTSFKKVLQVWFDNKFLLKEKDYRDALPY